MTYATGSKNATHLKYFKTFDDLRKSVLAAKADRDINAINGFSPFTAYFVQTPDRLCQSTAIMHVSGKSLMAQRKSLAVKRQPLICSECEFFDY